MDTNALADILFPDIDKTIEHWEAVYPPRKLPPNACVTRFAPSPTGYLHIGGLFSSLLDERMASNGGIFYLRIEDTDFKRKIDGGIEQIVGSLTDFELAFDEGPLLEGGDSGSYGPYCQSQRLEIYHTFAKHLVRLGYAYPCFCSEEDLAAMRARQQASKHNFGYYGAYAVHRNASLEEIQTALAAGNPFVLRIRSQGDPSRRVKKPDLVRGMLDFPENDQDMVLIKSDGLPTYHFAHLVDDHLMRTTHVVRGEEWLSTLPLHHELFTLFGFTPPQYIHTPQIMKLDNGNKRKISKRLDPEASVSYFLENGYPTLGVLWYLMSLLNSNFEGWMNNHPGSSWKDYPFQVSNIGASGALFDHQKLNDVCKNLLSAFTVERLYTELLAWSSAYAHDFEKLVRQYSDDVKAVLAIGRGGPKPRKDICRYSDLPAFLSFLFDETFSVTDAFPVNMDKDIVSLCFSHYCDIYDPSDDSSVWFEKVKAVSEKIGFSPDMKQYKANPSNWPGHVGDVSMALRVAVTGRRQSPDLCEVMRILGLKRVKQRLSRP